LFFISVLFFFSWCCWSFFSFQFHHSIIFLLFYFFQFNHHSFDLFFFLLIRAIFQFNLTLQLKIFNPLTNVFFHPSFFKSFCVINCIFLVLYFNIWFFGDLTSYDLIILYWFFLVLVLWLSSKQYFYEFILISWPKSRVFHAFFSSIFFVLYKLKLFLK